MSSDTPESSADVMLERTPFRKSVGDCTLGHDKLIPGNIENEFRLRVASIDLKSPFNKFLSWSQFSGVNSSSLDTFRSTPSSGVCSLSDGSICSFASNTIWWLPLTSFWSSLFVVVAREKHKTQTKYEWKSFNQIRRNWSLPYLCNLRTAMVLRLLL